MSVSFTASHPRLVKRAATSTLDDGQVVVVCDLGVEVAGLVFQLGGQRLHGPDGHSVHGEERAVQPVQAPRKSRQHYREQAVAHLALAAAAPGVFRPRAEVLAAPPALSVNECLKLRFNECLKLRFIKRSFTSAKQRLTLSKFKKQITK